MSARMRAAPLSSGGGDPLPWSRALALVDGPHTWWLATAHPSGRPHLVPVLAVLVDGVAHLATRADSRKARNAARVPSATLAVHTDALDLTIEGELRPCADPGALRRVVAAYRRAYGWEVEARDGALHGQGAPTAGEPPYLALRLRPRQVLGLPADGTLEPTRWTPVP